MNLQRSERCKLVLLIVLIVEFAPEVNFDGRVLREGPVSEACEFSVCGEEVGAVGRGYEKCAVFLGEKVVLGVGRRITSKEESVMTIVSGDELLADELAVAIAEDIGVCLLAGGVSV